MFTREGSIGPETHMQIARRSGDANEFSKFGQRINSPRPQIRPASLEQFAKSESIRIYDKLDSLKQALEKQVLKNRYSNRKIHLT